ncbi:MAG: hypothetical protein AMJ77_04720 [Dehalococcoidia bacterium SM23_28_2]|nr:MAG: hypothetical protein AMJ77_04720 [Dehalococcoidia bacterium SM23_28_2]
MRLFGRKRKRESDGEEKELVLDTEAEEQAPDQDDSDAEVKTEAAAEGDAPPEEKASAPEGDLLGQIGAEADSEIEAGEAALEAEGGASKEDDSLDPDLADIFRDAKEEVEEGTLAAELENVPVQDLLNDLLGLGHHLGIGSRGRAETGEDSKQQS